MLKYAKVINPETGQCDVGSGSNSDYYLKLGFTLLDVCLDTETHSWFLAERLFTKQRQAKLLEAKLAIENIIYTQYPIYKQNNLAIYGTKTEKQAFKEFKEAQVAIYDELVQQINNCNTVRELEAIDIAQTFIANSNNPQEAEHANH